MISVNDGLKFGSLQHGKRRLLVDERVDLNGCQQVEVNLRFPAFQDDVSNDWIHVIWYVETTVLKPDSPHDLHRVHSSPGLSLSAKLPEYHTKAINITSAF